MLTNPDTATNDQIIEAACEVFRCGFTEQHPAPFKLPSMQTALLLGRWIHNGMNLTPILATVSSFLASYADKPHTIRDELDALLSQVVQKQRMFLKFNLPPEMEDTEVAYATLDMLTRLFSRYSNELFHPRHSPDDLQVMFELAMKALASADTLSRRSAASFWAAFVDLSDARDGVSQEVTGIVNLIFRSYAQRLIANIISLVGGECARSDISALTDVLKKLILKQNQITSAFIREVMKPESTVLSSKARSATSASQKSRFAAQIIALRGAAKTIEIVKDFWLACRGSAFEYVS